MQNCSENQNAQQITLTTQMKCKHAADLVNGQKILGNNQGYAHLSGEQQSISEASPSAIEKANLKQQQQKVNGYQKEPQQEELTIAETVLRELLVKFIGFSIAQCLVLLCLVIYQLPYLLNGDDLYLLTGINYIQSIIFFFISYSVGFYSRVKYLPRLQFAFQILIVLAFIFEAIGNIIIFTLFLNGNESRDNLQTLFGLAAFSIFFFWISSGILWSNSKEIRKVMLVVIMEQFQKKSKRNQQNALNRIIQRN